MITGEMGWGSISPILVLSGENEEIAMRRKLQRFVGLIAAAALCAAIPAGAAAAEPNMLWDFGQEFDTSIAEPMEITTFDTGDTGTSVVTTGADTTVENTGYYTVTIPATVSVSGTDASGKPGANFTLSGTVNPYRKLTIKLSSAHGDKLVCGTSTLGYTLSATNPSEVTISNDSKTYSVNTDSTSKTFSANLAVEVTDAPTVSGEYSDTLTFTMDCQKVTQNYTVKTIKQGTDSTTETKTGALTPGEKLTLKDLYDLGIIGNSEGDNDGRWEYRWEEPDVTVPTDPDTPLNVTLNRKQVYLNLNALYYNTNIGRYKKSTNLRTEGDSGPTMAYVNLKINEVQTGLENEAGGTNYELMDYARAHPYGTNYEFYDIRVQPGYKLIGYFYNLENDSEVVDPMTKDQLEQRTGYTRLDTVDNTTTIKGKLEGYVRYVEAKQLMQTLYLVFEPVDTGTTTTQTLPDDGTTMMDAMRVTMESQLSDLTDDVAEPTPETATDAPDSPALVDEYAVDDYPVVFFDTAG